MSAPDTLNGWLRLVIAIGAVCALVWGAIAFSVEYHDRPVRQTLESIDFELRVQNCQRAKRANGASFEVAQLECAREERRQ